MTGKIDFNTTLVRFKHVVGRIGERAIKDFNTTLVRFKPTRITWITDGTQYFNTTLVRFKPDYVETFRIDLEQFQYYTSPIQTCPKKVTNGTHIHYFNTTLVRFKRERGIFGAGRLWLHAFQYYTSPIQTFSIALTAPDF